MMKYSYEEYLKVKEKKSYISWAIKLGIDGIADIPVLGNTIKAGAEILSESLENRNGLSESMDAKKHVRYFMLESDDYYDDLINKVFKILEIEKIKQKFNYDINDIEVELYEHFDDNEEFLEDCLRLTFLDNKFYNKASKKHEYGTIIITFKEEFKQINFENNKVYSVFKIIITGIENTNNDSDRSYSEFANLICYLLNNSKLIS